MTDSIKVGDWVKVEFEGEVMETWGPPDGRRLSIKVNGKPTHTGVPVSACTKISQPVRVGDIIDENSPEPPIDTTVSSIENNMYNTWTRMIDGYWYGAGSEVSRTFQWLLLNSRKMQVIHIRVDE